MMVDNVYILDNGAYTAKVELSKATAPRIIPNCIMKAKSERRRPFIGDQVEECRDASGLFYLLPFQKGFLVNWDVQKTVWDYIFSKECCYGNFAETPLVVTEPYFNFPSIQEAMSEIFFEEYECQSLLRINANCVVEEELQQLIEILQSDGKTAANLTVVGSPSYFLRYLSHKFTLEEDLKTILWEQNHNPLLYDSLCSDSSVSANKPFKQLWIRRVFNLQDEQMMSEINLIPVLHSCLHAKYKKQRFMSYLAELGNSEYLLEHQVSCETDAVHTCEGESKSSNCLQHYASYNCKTKINAKCLTEHLTLEEYCDSNDQPVNYSLKYFEHETPPIMDNLEEPVNFSLKYVEEMEVEPSMGVEMMFGAGDICYAETDLDQLPDVIFSYLENHCDETLNIDPLKNYQLSFSEEVKKYSVEGTPCAFSVDPSLSGICSPTSVEEAEVGTAKVPSTVATASCPDLRLEVGKKSEGMVLETPLMFSRCSSVSSLTSVEPLDDVRSVVSDYSRMASGMVSPSELPDSPTQTSAPNVHSFKLHPPSKAKSVFEEKVSVFKEESTPAQFSTTSSLSALSFDEGQLIETPSDFKIDQSVITSETASTDGKDDEDILAACISAGMQIISDNVKSGKHHEREKKVNELSSCNKMPEKEVNGMALVPNSLSKCKTFESFSIESSSLNITSTQNSDPSKVPEDPDHTDILAECIQAGMPKALGKSKCNHQKKKSGKISLKLALSKDTAMQKNWDGTLVSDKTRKDASLDLKSGTTRKGRHGCHGTHSGSHQLFTQNTEKSPLLSPIIDLSKNEAKLQLSRRSSIESIKEDATEDTVTLSELLMLEQCITSGMPKKKTR